MFEFKPKNTIKGRLERMSLVVLLIFVLMAVSLQFASRKVRSTTDLVVKDSLQFIAENSQNNRDFGLLNARLNLFKNTFYVDDQWFDTESEGIQKDIDVLREAVHDVSFANSLSQLQGQFSTYLKRREWINYLLFWRFEEDRDIAEIFSLLQEIVAEKSIELELKGDETDSFDQLVLLLSGYRESLSEIAKLNAEENPAQLLLNSIDAPIPLEAELRSLVTRLKALLESEPPIDRLGQHLVDRFAHYQYLMQLYQDEMVRLGEFNRELDRIAEKILFTLEQLDQQATATIENSRLEIKRTIGTAVVMVRLVLFVFAFFVWFTLKRLFKNHIQAPMAQIRSSLGQFQQGDLNSKIQLGREDEWADIEVVFNRMSAELQESFAALKKSEQRYRDIFNNATDGIFQVDLSGRLLNANPALANIFGFDATDETEVMAKMGHLNLRKDVYCRAEDRERWFNLIQQGEVRDFSVQMLRSNGGIFWAAVDGHPVYDEEGRIVHIEGTIRDISGQIIAQKTLEQLQVYLQNIIDSMPSVLIGVDINMEVTLWNKRAEQESVLTAEEAKGLMMMKVCRLFEPDAYLPKLMETLRTRKPTRLLKVQSIKKTENGETRFFDILIYPLSMTEASGAVIHMDDVTERLRLEEMMVRSEKMQAIGGLASGLAHEINNPLAVILQNVQVLTRRLSPELHKNREVALEAGTTIEAIVQYSNLRGCEQMLHSVLDAGQRAAKIVENVQSFSRRGGSDFTSCTLPDILERMVELAGSDHDMRHHFDFRKISIARDYQTVPDVCCDSGQIQQVLLSLLKNAAQVLSLAEGDSLITLRIFPSGHDNVCLQVEDNGSGMEADVVARIFDPFFTTREVGQGTGLGLSIAYFIVTHNHGGNLSVTSEVGKGSCFTMVLPLENDAETFVLD